MDERSISDYPGILRDESSSSDFPSLLKDERSTGGWHGDHYTLPLVQHHSVDDNPLQNAKLAEAANERLIVAELYTFEKFCRELQ